MVNGQLDVAAPVKSIGKSSAIVCVYSIFCLLTIMYIKPNRVLSIFLRNGIAIFFIISIIAMSVSVGFQNFFVHKNHDETTWGNVTSNFTVEHIAYLYNNVMESKPLAFLTVHKILGNSNVIYTRVMTYFLVFLCTILIYKITNNKLAFFYILIPLFLDALWLTAEIFEVFFILLSIYYVNRSGIFVGLAMLFRPTAILYSILLKLRQIPYVIIIGIIFVIILLSLGLFFPYWYETTTYSQDGFIGIDSMPALYFLMLVVMGITNKKMFPYVIVAAIPLLMKTYWHYFLPVYTFLFIGYLLNLNNDLKEIKTK